jgi:hypothetical protein
MLQRSLLTAPSSFGLTRYSHNLLSVVYACCFSFWWYNSTHLKGFLSWVLCIKYLITRELSLFFSLGHATNHCKIGYIFCVSHRTVSGTSPCNFEIYMHQSVISSLIQTKYNSTISDVDVWYSPSNVLLGVYLHRLFLLFCLGNTEMSAWDILCFWLK